MNSVTISWKLRLFMKVFKFMVFDCKIIMSLNTVPTNYHEFEYSKFSVFKLKFMTTGRIHASRCPHEGWGGHGSGRSPRH